MYLSYILAVALVAYLWDILRSSHANRTRRHYLSAAPRFMKIVDARVGCALPGPVITDDCRPLRGGARRGRDDEGEL